MKVSTQEVLIDKTENETPVLSEVSLSNLWTLTSYTLNMWLDREMYEATVSSHGAYYEIVTPENAGYPMFYSQLEGDITGRDNCNLTFEYQLNSEIPNPSFGFFTSAFEYQNWVAGPVFRATGIDPNNKALWETCTFNIRLGIDTGWGDNGLLRFDLKSGGVRMLIRNPKIVVLQ